MSAASTQSAPRTLHELAAWWHRRFAALCRELAAHARSIAEHTPTARAKALADAARHDAWAQGHEERAADYEAA